MPYLSDKCIYWSSEREKKVGPLPTTAQVGVMCSSEKILVMDNAMNTHVAYFHATLGTY